MATASSSSGIELSPDKSLLLSGRDVKDFFYQFIVNPQRPRRNILAGLLSPEDLSFIFRRQFAEPGYAALNMLAMGDCNACEFAQS